jgi:hypothetical protein
MMSHLLQHSTVQKPSLVSNGQPEVVLLQQHLTCGDDSFVGRSETSEWAVPVLCVTSCYTSCFWLLAEQ